MQRRLAKMQTGHGGAVLDAGRRVTGARACEVLAAAADALRAFRSLPANSSTVPFAQVVGSSPLGAPRPRARRRLGLADRDLVLREHDARRPAARDVGDRGRARPWVRLPHRRAVPDTGRRRRSSCRAGAFLGTGDLANTRAVHHRAPPSGDDDPPLTSPGLRLLANGLVATIDGDLPAALSRLRWSAELLAVAGYAVLPCTDPPDLAAIVATQGEEVALAAPEHAVAANVGGDFAHVSRCMATSRRSAARVTSTTWPVGEPAVAAAVLGERDTLTPRTYARTRHCSPGSATLRWPAALVLPHVALAAGDRDEAHTATLTALADRAPHVRRLAGPPPADRAWPPATPTPRSCGPRRAGRARPTSGGTAHSSSPPGCQCRRPWGRRRPRWPTPARSPTPPTRHPRRGRRGTPNRPPGTPKTPTRAPEENETEDGPPPLSDRELEPAAPP
jgi:hypothetical protein